MKLQEGKIYSVKELRETLDLPQKQGAMAMKQIRDIEREYELQKVKRGYYKVVRELTPEEKINELTYDKNRAFIEPILYEMLMTSSNYSITKDMHELMEEIEIVNKDFNYIKWHTKECSKIIQQSETGLQIFTEESEPLLKRIIRDILYDMQDKQLVRVTEIPVVAYKIYNIYTKTWFTRRHDIVNDKEVQTLLKIKRKLLDVIGVEKESDLKFYERGNFRDLIAKEYDASYFYYKYHIVINQQGLTNYENYDIIQLKHKFNEHIQTKMKKSKYGKLKELSAEEKEIYVKYCIDTKQDYNLRGRRKYND